MVVLAADAAAYLDDPQSCIISGRGKRTQQFSRVNLMKVATCIQIAYLFITRRGDQAPRNVAIQLKIKSLYCFFFFSFKAANAHSIDLYIQNIYINIYVERYRRSWKKTNTFLGETRTVTSFLLLVYYTQTVRLDMLSCLKNLEFYPSIVRMIKKNRGPWLDHFKLIITSFFACLLSFDFTSCVFFFVCGECS